MNAELSNNTVDVNFDFFADTRDTDHFHKKCVQSGSGLKYNSSCPKVYFVKIYKAL